MNSDEEIEKVQAEKETDTKESKVKYMFKEILIYALCIVIAFGAGKLFNAFVFQRTIVDGQSMESTLHNKDVLIVNKLIFNLSKPERFDIIVFMPFPDEEDTLYVKRVIGLPGDTIQIVDADIYINDEILEENYGREEIRKAGIAKEPIVLGDDEYFVMGDNRNESYDSRAQEIGPIKEDSIIGKAWLRIYPFSSMGVVNHK